MRQWTGTQLLDLAPGVGQRIETVRYDVLRADRSVEFTLTNVEADHPPTISWDSTSSTNRTLNGLTIGPADASRINPLTHRLAPYWVLDTGDTYPLGVFLFSGVDRHVDSWGSDLSGTMYDQSVILNQPRESSLSIGVGGQVRSALQQIVDEVGLTAYASIDPTPAYVSTPVSWQLGTSRGQTLTDLCLSAGFYPWYFDNTGILRLRAIPNPLSTAPADLTFNADASSRIIAGSVMTSTDLVKAPNRYIVRGNSSASQEVSAFYDVPASAPHSKDNIGYVRSVVIDNQAVTDSASALVAAQAAYATDFSTYDWMSFQSSPEPRADGFQIASVLGSNYRVVSWSLPLTPGGPMAWKTRKNYT